jgi:hypothetical protein
MTLESGSPWLLSHCSCELRKSCAASKIGVFTSRTLFILKHYFASKSFSAAREAFSNAYTDREVQNKTTIYLLVPNNISGRRKCLCVTNSHRATRQQKLRPSLFLAVLQPQRPDTAARIEYCHWFRCFMREGFYVL